jgi:hypothetical protein
MKKKIKYVKPEPSEVKIFRDRWLKKGCELINITSLCEAKLGCSGSCNSFNEPDESIHHIQLWYRDEVVANAVEGIEIIDEDKYCIFLTEPWTKNENPNFIIFRKVKT